DTEVVASFVLREGQSVTFTLCYASEGPAILPPVSTAWERLIETRNYWRRWITGCRYEGPYAAAVRRSALALKLLIFAPSGAVVPAPTSSLPVAPSGSRNWDYSFCWLRAAAFIVRALDVHGYLEEERS